MSGNLLLLLTFIGFVGTGVAYMFYRSFDTIEAGGDDPEKEKSETDAEVEKMEENLFVINFQKVHIRELLERVEGERRKILFDSLDFLYTQEQIAKFRIIAATYLYWEKNPAEIFQNFATISSIRSPQKLSPKIVRRCLLCAKTAFVSKTN